MVFSDWYQSSRRLGILVGKSVPALCPRIDLRCKKCEKRETFVTSWRSYICKIVHERCTYIVCTVVVPCPGGSERKKKAVEIYYRSITFVNKIASFVLQLSRFHSHDVFSAFLSLLPKIVFSMACTIVHTSKVTGVVCRNTSVVPKSGEWRSMILIPPIDTLIFL